MKTRKGYITEQIRRYSSGEINRRRFIMSALGAGVTMPTAMSLASRAEARVPRSGGVLRYATASGTAGDRLGAYGNQFMACLNFARGNALIEIAPDGTPAPELAAHFEASPDAKRWVFELREGVRFHDGKSLDAGDVVATLAQHRTTLLADVFEMQADGPLRIVFTLNAGNTEFPRRLADPRLVILASHDGETVDPASPNGTGGYVIESFEPGVRAVLSRNPDYWKPNAAHFERVELVSMPDARARQHAVVAGDVDIIDTVDPRTVALLGRMDTLDVLETEGTRAYSFPIRPDRPPFDNADLRRALQHVIPGREMVDRVLLGHGRIGIGADIFDTAIAAQHYRASRHSGAVPLSVSDKAFPGAEGAARLIAGAARQAGIDVDVRVAQQEDSWERTSSEAGWRAASGTPESAEDVAIWANEIHVHSRALAHHTDVGADLPADGARIAERWWFA